MTQINAYVGFNGKCDEAMNFYKECIGGDLSIQLVKDSPIADKCPPHVQNYVLHSALVKGPLLLMATDMAAPGGFTLGNNIALSLSCSSEEEINTFYGKLSAGGKILDPLGISFWGASFGVLEDKYGVRWMLIYDKNQQ